VWRYRKAARGVGLASLALAVTLCLCLSPGARAGDWMVVSCENPNGTAAPSEGWSGYPMGSPNVGSDNRSTCAPGQPMTVFISNSSPAPSGAMEVLQYTPPAGSKLIGGQLQAAVGADGSGPYGRGAVGFDEPELASDESNSFFACVYGLAWCNGGNDFTGTVNVPSDRGGNLYAEADCRTVGGNCDTGGSNGAYAWLQIASAKLLLENTSAPLAGGFGGSALAAGVRGTGQLTFTASEPTGPGIYVVAVTVDGHAVYDGTPNTNGGACVPVGTDAGSGALMFDSAQPCPATVGVDVPVPTAGLADGAHKLAVTVGDAAQNDATVLDTVIHTSNPELTPVARRGLRAQFLISWRWLGRHTTLRSLTVRRLPRTAHVAVSCAGRGCPKLKVTRVSARHLGRLLGALRGRRFTTGDTLLITVTASRRKRERVKLTILNNRQPRARLVK
jgi:hypothetical protein